MSIKTTHRISRETALSILEEISTVPNDTLAEILDVLAESGMSHEVSKFDNFIVSDFS